MSARFDYWGDLARREADEYEQHLMTAAEEQRDRLSEYAPPVVASAPSGGRHAESVHGDHHAPKEPLGADATTGS